MNTIQTYINSIFAPLPATLEILHLKDEIIDKAQMHFRELRASGMSENEAVGMVLNQIGTLDDIMDRSKARRSSGTSEESALPGRVEEYIDAQHSLAVMNGIGVALCIMAPAFAVVFDSGLFYILGGSDVFGVLGMFASVAIAVMIFIYSSSMKKSWKGFPYTVFLTPDMCTELSRRCADEAPRRTASTAVGVGLCIMAPAFMIIGDTILRSGEFGIIFMFAAVACAVFLFMTSGVREKACRRLLKVR